MTPLIGPHQIQPLCTIFSALAELSGLTPKFSDPPERPGRPWELTGHGPEFWVGNLAGYIRGAGISGLKTGTSGPEKTAERAKRKWAYLSHPDSIFDDLGLVGIVTTSSTRIYRERS